MSLNPETQIPSANENLNHFELNIKLQELKNKYENEVQVLNDMIKGKNFKILYKKINLKESQIECVNLEIKKIDAEE